MFGIAPETKNRQKWRFFYGGFEPLDRSYRGPVEEPPKVFVLSYVCLNAYKHCFSNRLFLMHHLAWTKIALWLKRAHILFSYGLVHFTN